MKSSKIGGIGIVNLLLRYELTQEEKERILKAKEGIHLVEKIEEAEIIFGGITQEEFKRAKMLRWIQTGGAGVDNILFPELIESDIIITNASGIHGVPMAEHTFALILAWARGLCTAFDGKKNRKWLHSEISPGEIHNKTIGIIGYGHIGEEIARIARGFNMKVIAVKRDISKGVNIKPDELLGTDRLDKLLKESDIVVITVPLTKETYHLIGERELRLMKPTSFLVNIARGKVIDEGAIIKAIKENWIAGVGLDVFEKEPLPEDSELWGLENVIITPHIAGLNPYYTERLLKIFIKNLLAYPEISKMVNVVDKRLGY
ncbi:MAG: D-2-hydroxyacid dehydrogenase [bacterium]